MNILLHIHGFILRCGISWTCLFVVTCLHAQYSLAEIEMMQDSSRKFLNRYENDRYFHLADKVYQGYLQHRQWEEAANVSTKMAYAYWKTYQFSKAQQYIWQSIGLLENYRISTPEVVYRVMSVHLNILVSLNQLEDVEQMYEEMSETIKLFPDSSYPSQLVVHYITGASMYQELGAYAKSDQYYQKALAACEPLGKDFLFFYPYIYQELGILYEKQFQYNWAANYYRKAYEAQIEYGVPGQEVARTLYNLAYMEYYLGALDTALSMYEEALELHFAYQDTYTIEVADIYNTIGLTYAAKQQPSKALHYYNNSIQLQEKLLGTQHIRNAVVHLNIADLYTSQLNRPREAVSHIQSAENIYQAYQSDTEWGEVAQHYATTYAVMGECEDAISYAAQAVKHAGKHYGKESYAYGEALYSLARCYSLCATPHAALEKIDQALETFLLNAPAHNLRIVEAAQLAAKLASDDLSSQIDYLQLVLEGSVQPGHLPQPDRSPDATSILYPLRLLTGVTDIAVAEAAAHHTQEAAAWFHYGFELAELIKNQRLYTEDQLTKLNQIDRFYNHYIHFFYQLWLQNPNSKAMRRVLIGMETAHSTITDELQWLASHQDNDSPETNTHIAQIRNDLDRKKAELLQLQNLSKTEEQKILDAIITLTRAYDQEIAKLPSTRIAGLSSSDLSAIQAELSTDEAIVEYYIGSDSLLLIGVILPDTLFLSAQHLDGNLEKTAQQYREALFQNADAQIEVLSRLLYNWCISPVEEALTDRSLTIIPSASLYLFPFQSLLNGAGEYLIENHPVSYQLSLRFWQLHRQRNYGFRWSRSQIWAPISFGDSSLSDLPFSEKEVQTISSLVPVTVFKATQANELAFRKLSPQADLLHMATHSILGNPDWSQTHIALFQEAGNAHTDGRLYIHEINALPLSAKLVYLNACNSAIGTLHKSEGIIGLPRAFLMAGSSGVIGSYWNISDVGSADLVKQFYAYLKQGQTAEKALQLTQIDCLNSPNIAHRRPSHWSSLALIGDNRIQAKSEKPWYAIAALGALLLIVSWFGLQYHRRKSAI